LDALINWVTQIILFILLATIIDLLIPQTAMKKYIKLVVGLILILILLQPVFYLFQIDIETAVTEAYQEVQEETETHDSVENLIDLEKSEIQTAQHAYILEEMAVQLESLAEEPLREEFEVEITDMQFQFSDEEELTFEELEEITVYVKETDSEEGSINTVDEVVIDTEQPVESKASEEKNMEPVQLLLMELWELGDKNVTVIWEGGAS